MNDLFTVIEYSSGFAVRHNPTGQERWMSDGVGIEFGTEDAPLTVGMPGFCDAWTKSANEDGDTLEAYFPELALDIYYRTHPLTEKN